jgi:CHAT domain-containing protein
VANLEEAREAADRAQARNLFDVLNVAGVGPAESQSSAQEKKLRDDLNQASAKRASLLRAHAPAAKLAAADRDVDSVWTDLQSVRAKLLAADPRGVLLTDSGTLDLETLRREVIDPDTLLLQYSVGRRSYLWAVSQDALEAYELPARTEIDQAARAFWDAVKTGEDAAAVERAATRLSKMVLAPAAGMLGNKRLLVVADGALQYVPFAALADPAHAAGYRPLILSHEVVNEPSASTLALLRRVQTGRKPAPRTLAVFADPVFEADDPRIGGTAVSKAAVAPQAFLTRAADLRLSRLPYSRTEGTNIASLLPERERWLNLDFAANRESVANPRIAAYRILHFGTHGVLDVSRPELSALVLSLYDQQGKARDGFLRLYEINGLHMQADMVVLSACQTALGKEIRGEGLVGLARGFMHAGTPRVVASLWKVDDRATSELMRVFYQGMLGREHKSSASALRAAQLAIARQERWRSPYYWAAFVLQGEWR